MTRLTEKYRPQTWEEVVGQDKGVRAIRATLRRAWGVPHYLFIGPSGTGKTTIAMLMAKELGVDFHEFNASDDRGIDFVRDEIKRLSQYKGQRIIWLDEADQLTGGAGASGAAQHAMRRIMEKTDAIFILSGNDEWKIIDAIKSRCVIFRFPPIPNHLIEQKVVEVIQKEQIQLEADTEEKRNAIRQGIKDLVANANGDMRQALNNLEKIINEKGQITPESVAVLASAASLHVLALQYALRGNFEEAKKTIETAHIEGHFDSRLTFQELYKALETIKDREIKIRLYSKLGEVEANSKRGASPIIQIVAFMAYVWVVPHLSKCPVLSGDK